VDWRAVGLAGVEGHTPRFPDDLGLVPAARFVHFGGPWSWRGYTQPRDILNWTAIRLEELSRGNVLPVGKAMGALLRLRAEML
jgi:hypothetical protein